MLARGYTPPSILGLGSTPFWHDFTPFWHVGVWCAPDWLKNTAGRRLFVVVVVRKDYVRRRNDQRPRPAQTWSVYILYVISIPQGLVRRLLHTMMRHYESRSWVLTPISCSSFAPRRLQITQTQKMRTATYKSYCSCGLPVKTLIDGIGWWPVAPTRHNQRRKLHHHKATINTTCLQPRAPEVNLFRSRNPSRHASSWRSRPTVVHHRLSAPRPWTRIFRYTITVPNSTHYSACNNSKQ